MGSGKPGECGAAAPPRVEVGLRDVTACATDPSLVERLARALRKSISSATTESVLVCTPDSSRFPLHGGERVSCVREMNATRSCDLFEPCL